MEITDLEEIVENIILQHDYPGFEPRSLNLALPQAVGDAPVRLYLAALESKNVFVKLVGLRWFQSRAGAAKNHVSNITSQLESLDPFVRLETIRTIEIAKILDRTTLLKIVSLLRDSDEGVRVEAAKACGNLGKYMSKTTTSKTTQTNFQSESDLLEQIITALKESSNDSAQTVRRKVIKSLRKLGAYNIS